MDKDTKDLVAIAMVAAGIMLAAFILISYLKRRESFTEFTRDDAGRIINIIERAK